MTNAIPHLIQTILKHIFKVNSKKLLMGIKTLPYSGMVLPFYQRSKKMQELIQEYLNFMLM